MATNGLLVEVRWEWTGTDLTSDTVTGATVLPVSDAEAVAVDEQVWVEGTGPYTVTAVDPEADTVTVTPGAEAAFLEGTEVALDVGGQPGQVWVAEVVIPDAAEPIEVPLSVHDLSVMPEGTYNPPVAVVLSDDLARIVDLPGSLPVVDGQFIPPGTLSPGSMTDGLPPASSPAALLRPLGLGGLMASWTPAPNPDALSHIVYLSTAAIPDNPSAALEAGTTTGTSFAISHLPDGTALQEGVTYHCRVRAADYDGPAATAGPEATAQIRGGNVVDDLANLEANLLTLHGVDLTQAQTGLDAIFPIQTTDISDAAITSPKVAANTIQAMHVAARAISARHLVISDYTNIAEGSTFEDAAEVPWDLAGNARFVIDTAQFHEGAKSLRIDPGPAPISALLNKNVPVQSGQPFRVSAWIRKSADFNGGAGTGIKFSTAGGWVDWLPFDSTAATGDWVKVSDTITLPSPLVAGVTNCTITLESDATAGTIWVDDVFIQRMLAGELLVDGTVTSNKVSTDFLYSGHISTGQIEAAIGEISMLLSGDIKTGTSGQRVEIGPGGIYMFSSTDEPLVEMPTDPLLPAVFRGNVHAKQLTVDNLTTLKTSELEAGAVFTMEVGTTPPTVPPSVSVFHSFSGVTGLPSYQGRAYQSGMDSDGTYHYLCITDSTQPSADVWERSWVVRVPLAGGAATVVDFQVQRRVIDVAIIPGVGFLVLYQDMNLAGTAATYQVEEYDTAWNEVTTYTPPTGYTWRGIHWDDSGNTCMVGVKHSTNTVVMRRWTGRFGANHGDFDTGIVASYNASNGTVSTINYGLVARVADFGSYRVVIPWAGGTNKVFYINGSSLLESGGDRTWPYAAGQAMSMSWDGSKFWSAATWNVASGSQTLYWYTGAEKDSVAATFTRWASHLWKKGAFKTPESPRQAFTMTKRARISMTVGTIPGSGGANDPDSAEAYLGFADAYSSMWLQAAGAAGQTAFTFNSIANTGTQPPTTNNFPDSTPSELKSANGLISMKGDGSAALGDLSVAITGRVSVARGTAAAHVARRDDIPVVTQSARGRATLTFNNTGTASVGVSWPAFAAAPSVVATVQGSSNYIATVSSVTTTGCTITGQHRANTLATVTLSVNWIAMEI